MKRKICAFMITGAILCRACAVNAASAGSVKVDGAEVAQITDGMVPVRDVAQALGYEVEWIADSKTVTLAKGPVYVTFAVGVDGYTFAKTAPMPMGFVPVIIDGKTYVKTEFFTDALDLDAAEDENGISFVTENAQAETDNADEAQDEAKTVRVGTAADISANELSFMDDEMGEVLLIVNEDTEITDENGARINVSDIEQGEVLEVVYGDAMMDSLPPRNNPVSITATGIKRENALDDSDKEAVAGAISGTVQSNEDGLIHVVSDDKDAEYPEIVLAVSDNTQGDGVDAVKGDKVEASYSLAMTRSIPPQAEAFSISILK